MLEQGALSIRVIPGNDLGPMIHYSKYLWPSFFLLYLYLYTLLSVSFSVYMCLFVPFIKRYRCTFHMSYIWSIHITIAILPGVIDGFNLIMYVTAKNGQHVSDGNCPILKLLSKIFGRKMTIGGKPT